MPAVVLEIVAGVVVGPSVLGWVEADLPVSIVAVLGLAFLLFLAGLEIDVHRLRGPVLRLALLGYLVTLVLGLGVGGGLDALGWVSSPVLIAVTLSATSLGLVVPVLKDAGRLDGALGQTVVAAASVADFAAIVLLSLFFSTSESGTGTRVALLVLFAALVGTTAVAALAVARSMSLSAVVIRLQDTTARDPGPGGGPAPGRLRRAGRAARPGDDPRRLPGRRRRRAGRPATPASHPHFRIKLEALGLRLPDPGVLRDQRAAARPGRSARRPGGARSASRCS